MPLFPTNINLEGPQYHMNTWQSAASSIFLYIKMRTNETMTLTNALCILKNKDVNMQWKMRSVLWGKNQAF